MTDKPELEKRKMYIYSNYLYWLMGITIHFLISLIPTLATMLLIEPVIQNILLYAVMLLPVGPSLGAIIACVLKIIEQKDLNPAKDYWQYYHKNWRDSLKVWSLFIGVEAILIVDIIYVNDMFNMETPLFSFFFLLLFILCALVVIPVFVINIKFKFSLKDLLKLGIFYTLTRFKLTVGNACISFLTYFIMTVTIEILPLLFGGVLVYLIVAYNYETLVDIKGKYIQE